MKQVSYTARVTFDLTPNGQIKSVKVTKPYIGDHVTYHDGIQDEEGELPSDRLWKRVNEQDFPTTVQWDRL